MSDVKLRIYTIHVRETRVFWDTVEVQASSEGEARELALEEFQCDWCNSDDTKTEATVRAVREL